jgi:hypothetical protein
MEKMGEGDTEDILVVVLKGDRLKGLSTGVSGDMIT